MNRILEWLGKIPTTNVRILTTILAMLMTTIKYVVMNDWTPSTEWLFFLAGMAGIDTATFAAKRVTAWQPDPPQPSTDVQEISKG